MLLSIDKQALRETGLSRQKIDYLCNISKYFIENPNKSTNEYFLDANEETIKSNLIRGGGRGYYIYNEYPESFPSRGGSNGKILIFLVVTTPIQAL